MVSSTFELFDVNLYIPEIQVALKLAPSINLAAKGFAAKDFEEALFPFPSAPTLKGFASYVKREIIPRISASLDFDVPLKVPSGGLNLAIPTLSANGLNFGGFSSGSTQLFPPSIDLDDVEVMSMCWFGIKS